MLLIARAHSIYVYDSIANRDVDISLLNAMLHSSPVAHTPLLVLATSLSSQSAGDEGTSPPPVQVAEWLSLIHIQHPWQVRYLMVISRHCNSNDMNYSPGANCDTRYIFWSQ